MLDVSPTPMLFKLEHPNRPGTETHWNVLHGLESINVILQSLTLNHKIFTAIDLESAFFTIPLNPEHQQYFTFTYRGQ